MTDLKEKVPDQVFGALQRSGFPFQTVVAHVIRNAPGWSIYASEYRWQGPGGDDQFLDLVATNGKFYLVIECKKTRKDILTFLLPVGHSHTGKRGSVRVGAVGRVSVCGIRPVDYMNGGSSALYPHGRNARLPERRPGKKRHSG